MILFLAYINDLHESITNSNVRLFADDCVLYRDITDRNDTNLLQQDLDALGRWEANWLMAFNVDKCFVMHATHSKHKIQHQYTLHNQTLTPVKHSKYLGVTLSDDLTWRTHISNVVVMPPEHSTSSQNSPNRIAKHQSPCIQGTCSTKTRIRALCMGSADYLTLNPRPNRNRHHLCYNIPSVDKDCLKFSFFVRTTRDWNLVYPLPELFQSWSKTSFY